MDGWRKNGWVNEVDGWMDEDGWMNSENTDESMSEETHINY